MMQFSDFFKKSFYLLLPFTIFLAFLMAGNLLKDGIPAAWAGLIIAYLNFLAGAAIISWGYEKPDKQFYSAFFGGMIVRFVIIFATLFILIKLCDVNRTVLVISLIFAYFSFLILEIWDVNKYTGAKGKNS